MFVRHVDESLFVPEGVNASVIEILAEEHANADALESLKALHSIAHVFQYMENPAHELIRCLGPPYCHAHPLLSLGYRTCWPCPARSWL